MTLESPFTISLRTDVGRVRGHNEDFIASWLPENGKDAAQNGWLLILADGAGGMDAGEVASSLAVERTLSGYREQSDQADKGARLYGAMISANDALRDLMLEEGNEGRMATTMVATVLEGRQATIANIGDSRAYHWRDGVLRQVTRDHSLVARLVEEDIITPEEALTHPRRNVIYASLGSDSTPQIELFELTLNPGDQLLMCSDGLTGHVSNETITRVLGEQTPEEATETLIALANADGGTDNISAIVVRLDEMPQPAAAANGQRRRRAVSQAPAAAGERRFLWWYTAFLCLLQTVLIFAAWQWLVGSL